MAHVTFIHGIGNKPAADRLLLAWRAALAPALGDVTTGLVYWADLLYAAPLASETPSDEVERDQLLESAGPAPEDPFPSPTYTLPASTERGGNVMRRLADRIGYEDDGEPFLEGLPLPAPLKRRIMKTFLRDVDAYLFNRSKRPRPGETWLVQDEIRRRVRVALAQAPSGPHLVIGHSMGTVIAYDCLLRDPACPPVDALLTLGSPLGLDEVHGELVPGWTADDGFPRARLRGTWTNIFDRQDLVSAFAPLLADSFLLDGVPRIVDIEVDNSGLWKHDALKYFAQDVVQLAVRSGVGA